jgi:CO/xanthine dehydrogenase Mo-binding subunit
MSAEFRVIGKRQPKLDGFEKVTGRAKYAGDYSLPGMLCLKVLRSPYPHARVVSIDTAQALALPGVKAVLTAKDMPAYRPNPWMPILTDVARFVGDDIAVVAAVDEDTAVEALGLIKVDYQVLPFVLDPEEALKANAPKLFPEGNLIGGAPAVVNRSAISDSLFAACGGREQGRDRAVGRWKADDLGFHPGTLRGAKGHRQSAPYSAEQGARDL